MGSDRDSITAMKRTGLPTRIAAWASVVTAIVGALSQVFPPIWDAIIGDDLDRMKADIAQCQGDLKAQKKLLRVAVKVTENRIIEVEKGSLELEGDIRLIGVEVRLRHGGHVDGLPMEADRAIRSRSVRLRMVAKANDERMSVDKHRTAPGSLVEDMRREGAPIDYLGLDD